jgi:hypothetical protein
MSNSSKTAQARVLRKYPKAVVSWRLDREKMVQGYFVHDRKHGLDISGIWPTEKQAWADAAKSP